MYRKLSRCLMAIATKVVCMSGELRKTMGRAREAVKRGVDKVFDIPVRAMQAIAVWTILTCGDLSASLERRHVRCHQLRIERLTQSREKLAEMIAASVKELGG